MHDCTAGSEEEHTLKNAALGLRGQVTANCPPFDAAKRTNLTSQFFLKGNVTQDGVPLQSTTKVFVMLRRIEFHGNLCGNKQWIFGPNEWKHSIHRK
jgi:hypothetical protein